MKRKQYYEKSKKVTIISIVAIIMIMGILQIYHYCLNLSVELPQEVDQAVTECLETMIEPDEYLATFMPLHYDFATSAYHAFGYTEDDTYIKVYGYCVLFECNNETLKENKERKENILICILLIFGKLNYFIAYLKKDGQSKVTPEKIWNCTIPTNLTDILKKMTYKNMALIYF